MPSDQELKAYYDRPDYFEGQGRGGYESYDFQTFQVLPVFEDLLDNFGAGDGRRMLDIGCAYGTHLARAHRRGWNCFGVELSEHARRVAHSRYGNSLFIVQDVNELEPSPFDAVCMFDVIEHLKEPYAFFSNLAARGLIDKATTFVITTPNARSYGAISIPAEWSFRHPPSHLIYYSSRSFHQLFGTLGVTAVQVSGIHPIPSPTSTQYPDEDATSEFVAFDGLLCTGSGWPIPSKERTRRAQLTPNAAGAPKLNSIFQPDPLVAAHLRSLDLFENELIAKTKELQAQGENIQILRGELDEKISELHHRNLQLQQHDASLLKATEQLQASNRQLRDREKTLTALQQTKPFEMQHWLHQPFSLRKWVRISYLLAAVLMPQRIRIWLHPLTSKLRRKRQRFVVCMHRELLDLPKSSWPEQPPIEKVSVLVPTKNAGPLFEQVLQGITRQTIPWPGLEIVVVDSGSTDGTVALARKFGARVIEIDPKSFNHGLTRNLAIEAAQGDAVVLMTQDAVPGDASLIANLLAPLDDPRVAGSYARQVPRPEADVLTQKRLNQWLTGSAEAKVQAIEDAKSYASLSPMKRYMFCNFDNVCSAIRKSAWRDCPLPAAEFGEDIEWGKCVLERGWKIAYQPGAFVIHSHDRSVGHEYERTRQCHKKLHELFGLTTVPSLFSAVTAFFMSTVHDSSYVMRAEKRASEKAALLLKVPAVNAASAFGQYRGVREARKKKASRR